MATMVYQGLQSCLESQIIESRTLRLRLPAPKPHFSQSFELALKHCFLDSNSTKELINEKEIISQEANFINHKHTASNSDSGGWSILQALSNTCRDTKESSILEKENNGIYVHPLVKRSSSTLSEKSLELCTESLGSETGTDIIERSSIDSLVSSSLVAADDDNPKVGNSPTREQKEKSRQFLGAKKPNYQSFPPPLTTMSGSESLQVRAHREDGRLIIKGFKAPSKHTYFQAERSHGRLRLSFVKDSVPEFDSIGAASAGENVANNTNKLEEIENDMDYNNEEEEEEQEGNGNEMDVEGEMGTEEFQRPSRCNEGDQLENKGLLNWEPFWVATS